MKNSEAVISYKSCIYRKFDPTTVHDVVFVWYGRVVIHATQRALDPA